MTMLMEWSVSYPRNQAEEQYYKQIRNLALGYRAAKLTALLMTCHKARCHLVEGAIKVIRVEEASDHAVSFHVLLDSTLAPHVRVRVDLNEKDVVYRVWVWRDKE